MPDIEKDFPHRSVFSCEIAYGKAFEETPFFSKANLENIRSLIPYEEANLEENIDLLGIGGNMASAGLVNKNDDVMDAQTAINVAKLFKNKFINKEHDREKIIGHIITAGFSSMDDNRIISAEEALALNKPFHISTGGVLYKMVDREYIEMVEKSTDPRSQTFGAFSYSWEVAMKKIGLAIGSKDLSQAQIITDEKQVNELKKYLRAYGGSGKTNHEEEVYRLVYGECYPMGGGVVTNPAARMKTGLISDDLSKKSTFTIVNPTASENSKKNCVTLNKRMNPEEVLNRILAAVEKKETLEEVKASFTSQFREEIKQANEDYLEKVNAEKNAREKAEKDLADLKASQDAITKELESTKEKLTELETKAAADEAANVFSERMAYFDAEYDLDDEDKQVLAADLGELDTDEASFAKYKEKMAKLMKSKSKKMKEEKEKEMKAAVDKAIQERLQKITASKKLELSKEELEELLDETKASETPPPNTDEKSPTDFRSKFASAFEGDTVSVKF